MQSGAASPTLRTRIYIDGYNFYYGCLKSTPYKWLDLMVLFERHILPSILVEQMGEQRRMELLPLAIKFFTADILEKAARAADSVACQARYHTALRKLYPDRIECIKGYYSLIESKAKIIDAEERGRWPRDCQEILVWKLEEKQSDVSLALQMYHDAYTGEVDQIVIVTNDTDIAPALQMIRSHTSAIVGLIVPTRNNQRIPNTELHVQAHWVRSHITDDELRKSQLPRVIGERRSTIKPDSWYPRPDLLEQVLSLAAPIRGGRGKAFKWMEQPNVHLRNFAPIELIETDDGAKEVLDYIDKYLIDQHKPDAAS